MSLDLMAKQLQLKYSSCTSPSDKYSNHSNFDRNRQRSYSSSKHSSYTNPSNKYSSYPNPNNRYCCHSNHSDNHCSYTRGPIRANIGCPCTQGEKAEKRQER
ncbi:hypothetical protein AAES_259025 [Amazona aestiva]|uniref:Uncharacterized protein n=1 Tax=Amazona aestiva TaxID=12930 RepID=A0A0Q3PAS6_AMAAE|nr:hypothetical protein AAES_259025 [Amazona aestiva]